MLKKIGHFFRSEEGATAIEYALIASLISILIFAAVVSIGTSENNLYQKVATNYPRCPDTQHISIEPKKDLT